MRSPPEHVEAPANRASLLFHCRKLAESRADVEAAIRIDSAHPRLICLRGLLELEEGASERALESFTESIRLDPALADAWAIRATIRFRRGDAE
jgi:tetratricopeptide (TPR) repeat protein